MEGSDGEVRNRLLRLLGESRDTERPEASPLHKFHEIRRLTEHLAEETLRGAEIVQSLQAEGGLSERGIKELSREELPTVVREMRAIHEDVQAVRASQSATVSSRRAIVPTVARDESEFQQIREVVRRKLPTDA